MRAQNIHGERINCDFTLPWDSCWKKGTPSSNWALKWIQMVDLLLLCSFYKMVSILGLGTLVFHLLTAVCRLADSQTWASWISRWGWSTSARWQMGYHLFALQIYLAGSYPATTWFFGGRHNLIQWGSKDFTSVIHLFFSCIYLTPVYNVEMKSFLPTLFAAGAAGLLRWLLWFSAFYRVEGCLEPRWLTNKLERWYYLLGIHWVLPSFFQVYLEISWFKELSPMNLTSLIHDGIFIFKL